MSDYGLILLNGELGEPGEIKRLARGARAVICADGGARHAASLRISPRFIVGDMDSLPRPLPRWPRTVYACDFDEERGDFDKALDLAVELGLARVRVAGALGGATDHCLVNLAVAAERSGELEIELVGGGAAVLLGRGRRRLPLKRGQKFSLLALPPAARVSVTGARYPLRDQRLVPGSRGLGNTANGPVVVEIKSGRVWLMTRPG